MACGLSGGSMWALWLWQVGSVVVVRRDLSFPARDQTLSSALQGGFLTTVPPGKSLDLSILNYKTRITISVSYDQYTNLIVEFM